MWITHIADFIKKKFNFVRTALPTIPPLLLICEAAQRPGLSAIALATAIIQRLPEAGIMTGVNPDGSPNKILQLIRVFSEEVVREIKENSSVSFGIQTGGITIHGVGVGPTGPFTVTGQNLIPVSGKGISL